MNVAISVPEHRPALASTRRRWLEALGRAPAVRWSSGMWQYPSAPRQRAVRAGPPR